MTQTKMNQIESFKIIGISAETTNQDGKAAIDIGNLWGKFFAENISNQIQDKISNEIYSIYTDYESDLTGKYTTVLGLKVDSLDNIPVGLVGRDFSSESFVKFIAKGEMPDAVVETWKEIWSNDKTLNRKYSYDFEVYDEKSQNGIDSEVSIYIATESN
jgi:predicted transcriptional regulator YdeE